MDTNTNTPTPLAQRLRLHRHRKQQGLQVVRVEIAVGAFTRALRSRSIVAMDAQLDRTALAMHAAAVIEQFSTEDKEP